MIHVTKFLWIKSLIDMTCCASLNERGLWSEEFSSSSPGFSFGLTFFWIECNSSLAVHFLYNGFSQWTWCLLVDGVNCCTILSFMHIWFHTLIVKKIMWYIVYKLYCWSYVGVHWWDFFSIVCSCSFCT